MFDILWWLLFAWVSCASFLVGRVYFGYDLPGLSLQLWVLLFSAGQGGLARPRRWLGFADSSHSLRTLLHSYTICLMISLCQRVDALSTLWVTMAWMDLYCGVFPLFSRPLFLRFLLASCFPLFRFPWCPFAPHAPPAMLPPPRSRLRRCFDALALFTLPFRDRLARISGGILVVAALPLMTKRWESCLSCSDQGGR